MDIVWEGFKYGMLLTVMVGPIFFALIQTGVEEGFKAGLVVGLGIWFSDLLYILFVYFGMSYAGELAQSDNFTHISGLLGSAILVAIGIGTFLSKPPPFDQATRSTRRSSYINLFSRGFVINTFNPFSVFFWFSVTSTMVVNDSFNHLQALLFFGTIVATIMTTDLLKILLAKKISDKLTNKHIAASRRITGIILILFGIALLVRTFL